MDEKWKNFWLMVGECTIVGYVVYHMLKDHDEKIKEEQIKFHHELADLYYRLSCAETNTRMAEFKIDQLREKVKNLKEK